MGERGQYGVNDHATGAHGISLIHLALLGQYRPFYDYSQQTMVVVANGLACPLWGRH